MNVNAETKLKSSHVLEEVVILAIQDNKQKSGIALHVYFPTEYIGKLEGFYQSHIKPGGPDHPGYLILDPMNIGFDRQRANRLSGHCQITKQSSNNFLSASFLTNSFPSYMHNRFGRTIVKMKVEHSGSILITLPRKEELQEPLKPTLGGARKPRTGVPLDRAGAKRAIMELNAFRKQHNIRLKYTVDKSGDIVGHVMSWKEVPMDESLYQVNVLPGLVIQVKNLETGEDIPPDRFVVNTIDGKMLINILEVSTEEL